MSCGTDRIRCKIYIPDPPHPPPTHGSAKLSPKILYSPKGFMWLHRCACSIVPISPCGWLKEADFRNHTKNLPRKQVAAKSDSSILLSSARSAPESRFPDLSLHVRSSRARRGDAVGFAHGHRGPGPAPDLLGLLQQPPRPDPLVAGPQGAQRIRSHHGRGTVWTRCPTGRSSPGSSWSVESE